ncbi:MAG TPA: hypothetical protein ENI92_09230 [Bacteroidetes bacterium]|nr:hypothetical protein [Bacteroidota bacterium]
MPSPRRRFGSLVPRRAFGGAVGRNYARRRLREYFRCNRELFPDNTDLLVRLYEAPLDWEAFLLHLGELLRRAGRLRARMNDSMSGGEAGGRAVRKPT